MRWLGTTLVCTWLGCQKADAPERAAQPVAASSAPQALAPSPVPQEAPAAPSPSGEGPCAAICANTKVLGCGSELTCLATCGEMRAGPVCGEDIERFLACAATKSKGQWECGEAMPALLDPNCDSEQAALAACLERHSAE
jgi:hypothetical protein